MGIPNPNSVFKYKAPNSLGLRINFYTLTGFRPVNLEFGKTEFRFVIPMVENPHVPRFKLKEHLFKMFNFYPSTIFYVLCAYIYVCTKFDYIPTYNQVRS